MTKKIDYLFLNHTLTDNEISCIHNVILYYGYIIFIIGLLFLWLVFRGLHFWGIRGFVIAIPTIMIFVEHV